MMIYMIHTRKPSQTQLSQPFLPGWVMTTSAPETLVEASFQSGAALSLLHMTLSDANAQVPTELLRQRLALKASVNCLKIEGRLQTEAEIRDAYYLTEAGSARGPAGDMLALWKDALSISLRHAGWMDRVATLLPEYLVEQMADWFEKSELGRCPVTRASIMIAAVLEEHPREEANALILGDIVLARSLGLGQLLLLLGVSFRRTDINFLAVDRGRGASFDISVHHAVANAARDNVRLAHELARRALVIKEIAPKLRSKGSDAAVNLFLSEDAISASSMLSPKIKGTNISMTDRSARRLCDRLTDLGAVKELTGRSTFRLYGVM